MCYCFLVAVYQRARLWNKTVDGWADDQIKLQFVEEKDQYWMILIHEGTSLLLKDSMGFIKRVPKSKNYERFKTRFEDKSFFDLQYTLTNPKIRK